jgi:hypothetical protein
MLVILHVRPHRIAPLTPRDPAGSYRDLIDSGSGPSPTIRGAGPAGWS